MFAGSTAGCSGPDRITPADELDVYAAALDTIADPGQMIVLVDSSNTSFPPLEQETLPWPGLRKADRTTLKSFTTANRHPRRLPQQLSPRETVVIVTGQQVKATPGNPRSYWDQFYRRFPGSSGWYELSAIGFNRGPTEALLFVQRHCGELCGSGSFVLLRKTVTGWRVFAVELDWVS
jgi:hypothetical protein